MGTKSELDAASDHDEDIISHCRYLHKHIPAMAHLVAKDDAFETLCGTNFK